MGIATGIPRRSSSEMKTRPQSWRDMTAAPRFFIAVVVQCFDRDRPIPIQVAFNVSSTALAIAVTFASYHYSLTHHAVSNPSTLLFLAACVYFVANTLPVAAVISLTERRSLRKIWADCYFWSFPYYLVGAGVAGMMSWLHGFTDW